MQSTDTVLGIFGRIFSKYTKEMFLKTSYGKCARSITPELWAASMEEMKVISLEAYKWLEQLPPNT